MNRMIHQMIQSEYQKKRLRSDDDVEEKRSQLMEVMPEFFELEKTIRKIGVSLARAIVKDNQSQIERYSRELDELKENINLLLLKNKYPVNYLQPKFECLACKDTGFVELVNGASRCACYRQLLINYAYQYSNLSMLDKENFESFREEYYSEIVDAQRYELNVSPRENIKNILETCRWFINSFSDKGGKSLFFTGPTGVGKTFMTNCIAKGLLDGEKTVLYLSAPRLFEIIGEHRVRIAQDEYEAQALSMLVEVDLLVIDDLGIENSTSAKYAELLNILNARHMRNNVRSARTIISTNLDIREIQKFYSERVASRILGEFELLKFIGDDIRIIKRSH